MRTRTCTRIRTPRPARARARTAIGSQRGVAMLLVLISLMMATVLTTSYLASRDNSPAIGHNASAAASARWAAESGIDFGAAILQTEKNWRTAHTAGRLVSNYSLAGSTMNIDLLDMETSLPPTAATENVQMTVTATVDNLKQTAVATAHVPPSTGPIVDVDLSEFAVFAANRLNMYNEATVARWPMAPLSIMGDRVYIGTRATGASSIALSDESAAVDTTVYHGPGASALLVAVANGQVPDQVTLADPIPLPASPAPGVAAPSSTIYPTVAQSGGSSVVNASTRYYSVTLKNGATRTLRGNITVITDEDLHINSNSKLIIDGNVKLVLFGDLEMSTGSIELKSGAKLTTFIRGTFGNAVVIEDGYIGNLRSTATRDATGTASYMDPERVTIYSIPDATSRNWNIGANSVVKGSLYAPDITGINVEDQSAIYGRVATTDISLRNDAALFYDPALNDRVGFTREDSPLYNDNGQMLSAFTNLASLDASTLQAAANSSQIPVKTTDGTVTPAGYVAPTATDAASINDPTPRPVQIEMRIVSLGDALKSWE